MTMTAMHLQDFSSREALAGALAWWREAGVDCDFADEATDWLARAEAAEEVPAPKIEPVVKAPPQRSAIQRALEVARGARIGGARESYPDKFEGFADFWLNQPDLDDRGPSGRVPPRGVHGAKLMLLVAQPEGEDDERLLSGPQGRLLAAILRAMGLAEEDTYCASALPRPAPLPDWTALAAQGLGDLTRHHIALAAPQRLLVFGRGLAPLLAENGEPAPALQLGGRAIPLMIAPRLDRLARMPGHRKQFWTKWLEWSAHA
ncbi:hypothetical protein Q9K01_07845 [Qipengyuania sp. DY56-A-20]|jgi:DNA polymerase|uniref:Uracil-DNA glycosylase n=1 Tax=Qipengyuania benthica TaxID=3067651 RepID=A0ABT9H930_9SPHN|nr:hypothetical protein [Qipengyuania sp. DY56-A-20]MDP4539529.1 hypothetical protein [Qipengyuania sp. DY56-A-20]